MDSITSNGIYIQIRKQNVTQFSGIADFNTKKLTLALLKRMESRAFHICVLLSSPQRSRGKNCKYCNLCSVLPLYESIQDCPWEAAVAQRLEEIPPTPSSGIWRTGGSSVGIVSKLQAGRYGVRISAEANCPDQLWGRPTRLAVQWIPSSGELWFTPPACLHFVKRGHFLIHGTRIFIALITLGPVLSDMNACPPSPSICVALENVVVTAFTTPFNKSSVHKLCLCIRVTVTMNSQYLPIQRSPFGLPSASKLCSLSGTNWMNVNFSLQRVDPISRSLALWSSPWSVKLLITVTKRLGVLQRSELSSVKHIAV
jgi:hypothetical protein